MPFQLLLEPLLAPHSPPTATLNFTIHSDNEDAVSESLNYASIGVQTTHDPTFYDTTDDYWASLFTSFEHENFAEEFAECLLSYDFPLDPAPHHDQGFAVTHSVAEPNFYAVYDSGSSHVHEIDIAAAEEPDFDADDIVSVSSSMICEDPYIGEMVRWQGKDGYVEEVGLGHYSGELLYFVMFFDGTGKRFCEDEIKQMLHDPGSESDESDEFE